MKLLWDSAGLWRGIASALGVALVVLLASRWNDSTPLSPEEGAFLDLVEFIGEENNDEDLAAVLLRFDLDLGYPHKPPGDRAQKMIGLLEDMEPEDRQGYLGAMAMPFLSLDPADGFEVEDHNEVDDGR